MDLLPKGHLNSSTTTVTTAATTNLSAGDKKMTAGAARNELWDAIYAEDYPRVQKLLETGGGERWVNEPHGAWKNTSVHVATVKENRKILNILIVHKGDVNAINVNGTTPLHIAVEKENRELVQCLLQSGAKLHKRNYTRRSPFELARTLGANNRILKMLEEHQNVHDGIKSTLPVQSQRRSSS